MITNVTLFSVLISTESVAENCWKGISFSWRTLLGTSPSSLLRRYFDMKQGYQMVHHTALPSSACVAYRTNFNDNSDIWWGHRKQFQEHGIHWSQLGAKVQRKEFITWPSNPAFEISECSQSRLRWGDAETYGFESKSDTLCASVECT